MQKATTMRVKYFIIPFLLLVFISCNVYEKQPKKPATYSITFRPPTKKESRMINKAMGSYTPRYVVEDIFAEKPTKFKGKEVRDSNGICCVLVPLDKADSIKLELEPKKAEGDLIFKSTSPTTKGKVYLGEGTENAFVDTVPSYMNKLKKLSKETVDSAYLSKHNIYSAMTGAIRNEWGGDFIEVGRYNLDTVPVIMLCADTSQDRFHSLMGWIYEYDKAQNDGRMCFWMLGYATNPIDEGMFVTKYTYLDKDKKPISKDIYIWMANTLKITN